MQLVQTGSMETTPMIVATNQAMQDHPPPPLFLPNFQLLASVTDPWLSLLLHRRTISDMAVDSSWPDRPQPAEVGIQARRR